MICSRTCTLTLVPFALLLAAAGFSRFAGASSEASAAPTDAVPSLDEDDPSEPSWELRVGARASGFGAGECPTGLVVDLWPPNHKYVDIDLEDVLGGQTQGIEIVSITQDEPVDELGDGKTDCDGDGLGTSVAHIRSERSGRQNGRVYEITYNAFGGACSGVVLVSVPHDRRGDAAQDDGQQYDSTEGCSPK